MPPLPNFIFCHRAFRQFRVYNARFPKPLPRLPAGHDLFAPLKQPGFNRLTQEMRTPQRLPFFFERRFEGTQLPHRDEPRPESSLGCLATKVPGDCAHHFFGARLPYRAGTGHFWRFVYGCELYTAFCFRTALAKWPAGNLATKISTHEKRPARAPARTSRAT